MSTLQVKIPDLLLPQLNEVAAKEKVSMDQIVSIAVAAQVSASQARESISSRARRVDWGKTAIECPDPHAPAGVSSVATDYRHPFAHSFGIPKRAHLPVLRCGHFRNCLRGNRALSDHTGFPESLQAHGGYFDLCGGCGLGIQAEEGVIFKAKG